MSVLHLDGHWQSTGTPAQNVQTLVRSETLVLWVLEICAAQFQEVAVSMFVSAQLQGGLLHPNSSLAYVALILARMTLVQPVVILTISVFRPSSLRSTP